MKPSDSIIRAGLVVDKFIVEDENLGRLHMLGLSPDREHLGGPAITRSYEINRITAAAVSYNEVDPVQYRNTEIGQYWPDEASAAAAARLARKTHPLSHRVMDRNTRSNAAFGAKVLPVGIALLALFILTGSAIVNVYQEFSQGTTVDSGVVTDHYQKHQHGQDTYWIELRDCPEEQQRDQCRTGKLQLDRELYEAIDVGDRYPEAVEARFGKKKP